ncbi:hypothetical protein FY140_17645 [Agrobacterium tumefaciens]|uniref:hypothetical protein n=1 Tax=Agrobacterium tumefaciens TaxID=358 RepID=UPI0021D0AF11|nr:hypothetical protein [Agrobacterium tumefaciens]UXT22541.1 hypothetical protein FY140_17645 [Agrobacterium tumefaciens]
MPKKGDRRTEDGKKETWHHELGWVGSEMLGWDGNRPHRMTDDEIQAEIDMATAEVKL